MNVPRGTMESVLGEAVPLNIKSMNTKFDVIVVGAGHAGCEAALAAGRLGASTAMITLNESRVAAMSCNPAIGGIAKSHIVRELDALGGQMGKSADASTIHYRRLNASKGPAVRARRVQCDIGSYHRHMLSALSACPKVTLIQGMVEKLNTDDRGVNGVVLAGGVGITARRVILTTGTFLRGLIHIGEEKIQAGRIGEPPTFGLTDSLSSLGVSLGRFKTGTPPRISADSVDTSKVETQCSEENYLPFSHEPHQRSLDKVLCYTTQTNPNTHAIITSALDRSPLYSGVIRGTGPRYCPSIEDKVVRFPQRERHQVILEPMDLSREVFYPNGISTSLPRDVQEKFLRSIAGLEQARIIHYGYAIEYDYIQPTQLKPSLEMKIVPGLFMAGQINGTSGYEEAAGQGFIAGVNAAFDLMGKQPLVLERNQAYIGVMIDDLVTKGTNEPYRMFTSRAEFRLLLREDNAFHRLMDVVKKIGIVGQDHLESRMASMRRVERYIDNLEQTWIPDPESGQKQTIEKILRRPEIKLDQLAELLPESLSRDEMEQVETMVKYKGYIARQNREIEKLSHLEKRRIPQTIDYMEIPGLSRELAEKLKLIQPVTLGQASRIDGMTPAALMVLSIWLKKNTNRSP